MQTSKLAHNVVTHDPATHVVEEPPRLPKKKIPIAILAVLGFILIAVGLVWYFNGKSFNFQQETQPEFVIEPIDETIIATVGSEKIYGEDLKYKKSQVPEPTLAAEMEAALFDRLIDESIILQAGSDANLVQLDGTVFNTPIKDQQARQRLITEVTNKINDSAAFRKGAYVSIWFMNTTPGPIGYEQGKQVALEKITALHQAVSSGQMSIKQAGEAIKNDSSLAQLDPVYKVNAYAEFDTRQVTRITFDDIFNQELLSLDSGEVSAVALLQDYENSDLSQPKKDAVYMFGQVTEFQEAGNEPFDAWLAVQKNNYDIVKQ